MEYFWIVLPKMGGFLLLVLIGFLASRLGVVKKEALTSISGFLIKIVLPALVMDVVTAVGETSYSWGLIYLGCSIGFMEFGGILRYKSVLLLAVCKLVAAPVAVYAIVSHFLPQTESLLLMLITGAPTMTSSSMLARQYNLNEDYASAAVVVTTLLCMATLPLLFLITAL